MPTANKAADSTFNTNSIIASLPQKNVRHNSSGTQLRLKSSFSSIDSYPPFGKRAALGSRGYAWTTSNFTN